MVAGTSARESVKEMKRLKNEPLLLLVIIAIILFVGIFVIYPVVKVILFPERRDLSGAVQPAPLVHRPEKQPVHDPDLHHLLHGGGIPLCIRYCPPGCSL